MKTTNFLKIALLFLLTSVSTTSLRAMFQPSSLNLDSTIVLPDVETEPEVAEPLSLFEHIYQLDGLPTVILDMDMKAMVRHKMKEPYQPASFELLNDSGTIVLHLDAKIKARGNMRKQVSYFPPVKLDFKKSELKDKGFLKQDNLKMVFPNNTSSQNQQRLYKEYLLYELYQQIEETAIHAKLVDVKITKEGKESHHFSGFIIEDEDDYAQRMDAQLLEKGIIRLSALDRNAYAKMMFFQYMIANTDFSVMRRHNIELVKIASRDELVAVPYDFDYCGFVGHTYAIPNPILPIKDVHERYFFTAYRMSESEFETTRDFYLSIEDAITVTCDNAHYMDSKTIKACKRYIKDFYRELKKSKGLKDRFVK